MAHVRHSFAWLLDRTAWHTYTHSLTLMADQRQVLQQQILDELAAISHQVDTTYVASRVGS